MNKSDRVFRLLFIINPASGKNNTEWQSLIAAFFKGTDHHVDYFILTKNCRPESIKNKINEFRPERVIAVGGDGTIKLAAECILHSEIQLGIIQAGSANGLARELGIPADLHEALKLVISGNIQTIHVININNQICIHLSDVGFNAFIVKKFETDKVRGMWGYIRAAWKVLWAHHKMEVTIQMGDETIQRNAAMIVLANATKYGSGAVINPAGKLDDDLFEVVIVKKISFREIFKMMVTHRPYDKNKTELLQGRSLSIRSKKKLHFQVDGQYIGKMQNINAAIVPAALHIIRP